MIAREGVLPVTLVAAAGGALLWAGLWLAALPVLALALFLGWVFGDRPRRVPASPLAVVGPVDGTVTAVERGTTRWLEGSSLRIRVRVAWPGVCMVRAPIEGTVEAVETGYLGEHETGSPDLYAVRVRTDEDEDVVYVVRSEWPLSRFRSYAAIGERVGHGRRCGFVYFATAVDVLAPAGCACEVEPGTPVRRSPC